MVIPSNEMLNCRHAVGITTVDGTGYLVYLDEIYISDIAGMIAFNFCPFCGLELSSILKGGPDEKGS